MKIFVDTNIVLDLALDRKGLADESGRILDWCETHPGEAGISGHSLATIWYFLSKAQSPALARKFIKSLLNFIAVVGTETGDARRAMELPLADFEDALVASAAESVSARWIVTRNTKDFRGSPVPAMSPKTLLEELV